MAGDYLIVDRKILPDYLPKVIEAQNLLNERRAKNVSEAARMAGISRSTYYKYKDMVYVPEDRQAGHKAVITMILRHETGSLSQVLNVLSKRQASVITISQSIPVSGKASVTISLDTSGMTCPIQEMIRSLQQIPVVKAVQLNAME